MSFVDIIVRLNPVPATGPNGYECKRRGAGHEGLAAVARQVARGEVDVSGLVASESGHQRNRQQVGDGRHRREWAGAVDLGTFGADEVVDLGESLGERHRSAADLDRHRAERIRAVVVAGAGVDDERHVEPLGRLLEVLVIADAGLDRSGEEEVVDRAAECVRGVVDRRRTAG